MPIALPTSTLSPSSSVPSSSWRKLRSGLVWVCTSFLLSACASKLPAQVDRPASSAQPPAASSPLVQISQQRQKAESKAGAGASGFEILAGAQAAYGARLALVQGAKYTLDVQYYAIHADASTARLLEGVVNAARRGVRVRVLLDDFFSRLNFNPRSRVGSDLSIWETLGVETRFQSTLPCRERRTGLHSRLFDLYFNPRSRVGSDPAAVIRYRLPVYFNPRSRVGSDN